MAYEAHKWKIGEEITSEKLNHIEKGIEEAGGDIQTNIQNPTDGQTLKYDAASGKWVNGEGGGSTAPLIVNGTLDTSTYTTTLDKTWKEIHDAFYAYTPVFIEISNSQEETLFNVLGVIHNNGVDADYVVYCTSEYSYRTLVENGYPSA